MLICLNVSFKFNSNDMTTNLGKPKTANPSVPHQPDFQ